MQKIILLCIVILLGCCKLSANKFQIDSLNIYIRDFDYLIQILEETHPDPYTGFGGRPYFFRAKEVVRNSLENIQDTLEFVNVVNSFLANIEDGHTMLRRQDVQTTASNKRLPLVLKTSMDGILIIQTDKKYKNIVGGLILSINGIPLKDLLVKSNLLFSAENKSGSYLNLIKGLNNRNSAEAFFGQTDSLLFTVKIPDGNTVNQWVDFQENIDWIFQKSFAEGHTENRLLFTKLFPNAGYLRWNGMVARELIDANIKNGFDASGYINWAFSFYGKKPTGDIKADAEQVPYLYENFAELLERMEKAGNSNLIIDLRYNGGGMTPLIYPILYMLYGEDVLKTDFETQYDIRISPLLLKKWKYDDLVALNNHRETDYKYGDFMMGRFGPLDPSKSVEELMPLVIGWEGIGEEAVLKGVANRPDNLKVYVLVSPQTFSAAYHFSFFLWKMGAKTVGVSSSQAGNTFMETTEFILPNTNIKGSVSNSIQIFFLNDKEMGKEMKPDIPVSWQDFLSYDCDYDTELLKVLDIIKEKR